MVGILAAIGAIGTVAGAINSVVGVAKTAMGFFGGRRGGGGGGGGGRYYAGGGGGGGGYYAGDGGQTLRAANAAHSAAKAAHAAAADAAATGHRIERRIEDLDHRLTYMDSKLDGMDSKLDGLGDKLEGLGMQLQQVGDHVNKMRLSPLKGAFNSLKEAFISYESENYSRANECFKEAEDKAAMALHQSTNAEELVTSAQLKIAAAYMVLSYEASSGMVTFFSLDRKKQKEIARTIQLTVDDLLSMLVGMPGKDSEEVKDKLDVILTHAYPLISQGLGWTDAIEEKPDGKGNLHFEVFPKYLSEKTVSIVTVCSEPDVIVEMSKKTTAQKAVAYHGKEENQNIRVIDWGVIGLSFRFSDGFSSPDSRVTLTVESKTLKSLTTPCDACGWPGTSHVYNGRNLCEIDFQKVMKRCVMCGEPIVAGEFFTTAGGGTICVKDYMKQHAPAPAPAPAPPPPKVITPVQTGPYGGTGGTAFKDDSKKGKVTGVCINAGLFVDGISLKYGDEWGAFHGGGGGKRYILNMESDEWITKVEGKADRWIKSLKFVTNKGRSLGPVGGNGGNAFSTSQPDRKLAYISGRAGTSSGLHLLEAITLHWI